MTPTSAIETGNLAAWSRHRRRAQSRQALSAGRTRRAIYGLAAGLVAFGLAAPPLHAGELAAMTGESIDVGGFHGVVYYTPEADGHRVVATIADDGAGSPVRFSAILGENQSATLSVAGKLGEPAQSLKILRSGGKILLVEDEASSGDVGDAATSDITQ